jgi:hypothetical protein
MKQADPGDGLLILDDLNGPQKIPLFMDGPLMAEEKQVRICAENSQDEDNYKIGSDGGTKMERPDWGIEGWACCRFRWKGGRGIVLMGHGDS